MAANALLGPLPPGIASGNGTASADSSYMPSSDTGNVLRSFLSRQKGYQDEITDDRAKVAGSEVANAVPTLTAPPPREAPTDPFQAFGQPAMFLAIFGSLLTRRPFNNAVLAGANVLKSTQQLDSAAAQRHYDEWKLESENALKLAKFSQDAYKNALSKLRTDQAGALADARTTAVSLQDEVMLNVLETQGVTGLGSFLHSRKTQVDAADNSVKAADDHLSSSLRQANLLLSRDPVEQAEGVHQFAAKLAADSGGKGSTPTTRQKTDTILLRLASIEAGLLSGDDALVAKARADAEAMGQDGPGILQASKAPTAVHPPSEMRSRFDDTKARMQKDGTYTDDTAVWDSVKKHLADTKAAETAGAAPEDHSVAIADKLYDGDPRVVAEGLDVYRQSLLQDSEGSKATPASRMQAASVAVRLASAAAKLRNSDPAIQEEGRKEASEIADIGPGVLHPTKLASPGSVGAQLQDRFRDVEAQQRADGTYKGPSGVWDKVNQDVFISRSAQFSPGVAEMVADQIIAGNTAAASGFGRSPQLLKQLDTALLKEMNQHVPPLTGGDIARIKIEYAAYAQGVKAFEAGGKLEPVVRSLDVATSHLGVLEQVATSLAQNDVNIFNRVQNAAEREFGWTAPPTFDAIKGIVAAEIEKAVTGSAGAVQDREDLKTNLSSANSPAQLAAVIQGYERLMAGQIGGLRQSYDRVEELGHQPGGGFDQRFLKPETINVINRAVQGGAGTGSGRYIENHIYMDKNGHKAVWRNGQFVDVP